MIGRLVREALWAPVLVLGLGFATRLQKDNLDTMTDLLLSVCGAALYLAFAAFRQWSEEPGGR